ncbi:MAG TPA: alginate export family protein [Vicinamibacterales bacterium]|nr:alginate export family protein [Vicinamibacterales bacterium]
MIDPRVCFAFFAWFALFSGSIAAQTAEPSVTGSISNVTRVESWSYFQPRLDRPAATADTTGDPDYTFIGDRAELAVRVDGARFDLAGAFNYVRLENLPTRAIGPGGLGTGAFYFAATGVRYSYQLYLGELNVRMRSKNGLSLTVGRMPFSSGSDGKYARQGDRGQPETSLQALTRERLHSRLVGNFEWSLYQRRFDGVRLDVERSRSHLTAALLVPTQGGFEESTNLSIPRIQLAAAEWTRSRRESQFQAFGYLYRDRRGEAAVVENSLSFDRPVNITMATAGGSYARVSPSRAGEFDAIAWAAMQIGDWYGRSHRAASLAIEAGHRWSGPAWRPRLRGGYLWASGDRNPDDGRHGTFFQMIPSSRKFALSSVYAQMNLSDAFAQLLIEPTGLRARIEVHALHLASGRDLWYQGSGATAAKGRYFGFSARPADGRRSLGSVVEGTVEIPLRKFWSLNGYAGVMSAGDAVQVMFTGQRLTLWSIENVIRF